MSFKRNLTRASSSILFFRSLSKIFSSLDHGNAADHGNAPDMASLSDVAINGLRTVKDYVKLYGEPHNVHNTRELQATRETHKAFFLWKKALQ